MIQTAGHDRAVAQNADVVAQRVAEAALPAVRGVQIRPVEALPRLEPHVVGQLAALAAAAPRFWKGRLQHSLDPRVQALESAAVPEAQLTADTAL